MSKHDRFLKAALVWASAIASMVFAASIVFDNMVTPASPSPRPDLEPPALVPADRDHAVGGEPQVHLVPGGAIVAFTAAVGLHLLDLVLVGDAVNRQ